MKCSFLKWQQNTDQFISVLLMFGYEHVELQKKTETINYRFKLFKSCFSSCLISFSVSTLLHLCFIYSSSLHVLVKEWQQCLYKSQAPDIRSVKGSFFYISGLIFVVFGITSTCDNHIIITKKGHVNITSIKFNEAKKTRLNSVELRRLAAVLIFNRFFQAKMFDLMNNRLHLTTLRWVFYSPNDWLINRKTIQMIFHFILGLNWKWMLLIILHCTQLRQVQQVKLRPRCQWWMFIK